MFLVMITADHGNPEAFFATPLVDPRANDTPTERLGVVDTPLVMDRD